MGRALLLVPFLASGLWAQPDRMELKDLLAEALNNNPEIASAQKRYEASRQRPTQVSSLPDPMFSPGYNSSGRPWPGAGLGTDVTATSVMVSRNPFPGKRKLAGDMAVKESEAEWQQYQQTKLSVVSRLKQAYFRRAYAFAAVDVLSRNLDLLRKFLQITESRYSVGKAAQQDVFKAQTQISILETKRVQLDREKRARAAEINSLVNRAPGSPIGPPSDLPVIDLPATLQELYTSARENSPMLHRDEKMIQRAEVAVNMARKEYYPDFTLNGGYYNMGGMAHGHVSRRLQDSALLLPKTRAAVTEQSQNLAQSRKTYERPIRAPLPHSGRLPDGGTSSQLVKLYGRP
jgi:outer membrane protein TolC